MLDINLWTGFNWLATLDVRSLDSLELTLRHNQTGQATITMSSSARKAPLLDRGVRLTIDRDGNRLFSGPMVTLTGEGPSVSGSVTATFESDLRLMDTMLLYPCPEQAAVPYTGYTSKPYEMNLYTLAQTSRGEQTITGPSETILKTLVANNAGRFPGLTVAPDQGRGTKRTVQVRMTTLAEEVVPLIEADGMGVSVTQTDSGLVVDVYQTQTFPHDLSEIGGTVQGWTRTLNMGSATRVVVGGQGDMTQRQFAVVEAYAQQDAWHDVVEAFADATDSDATNDLISSGLKALDDAGATDGIAVTLTEAPNFRLGDNVWLGDSVTVELAGVRISEVLREVDLHADMGVDAFGEPQLSITPVVGDIKSSSYALYKAVRNIGRNLRRLGRH